MAKVLGMLDADFLGKSRCFFGGGTRIALELDEYRESADIDFLCSDREGYRALRSTIDNRSLGKIVATGPRSGSFKLAREVIADRYGIRTFVDLDGEKIKFEIVNEGRIELGGGPGAGLRVPCLDTESCFAEKFLANDDRWADESVLSRDVIDLAFMAEAWGAVPAGKGLRMAEEAYGSGVRDSALKAADRLLRSKAQLKRCVDGLRITKAGLLTQGLKKIGSKSWPASGAN
ncbi:MAG TPA: nucleotidyl transferase AbiEii/AbiGii toxin family protein [Burkholderiales bacterium]|nr:nucleotidyl transferase AbiEii/AbiGii toxin family protein [Burkholderiales bacterium]